MATTKNTTSRSRQPSRATGTRNARATSATRDESLAARTGRTLRDRPYTSAAIATGAVTAVAAVVAGAFFFSRRTPSAGEGNREWNRESITHKVKGSFADARARIKDLIHSDDAKSQHEIAEEALTLKSTGTGRSRNDERSSTEIKAGAIAY
jgi:hypothetical protein